MIVLANVFGKKTTCFVDVDDTVLAQNTKTLQLRFTTFPGHISRPLRLFFGAAGDYLIRESFNDLVY